ncbi:uncharacterized protein LOC118653645 isoform X3 [Myotis myotis]|uniref:uncharacterized protein LOC118653645 isoform X3 n=1 Tax=Myotis myotis TaxID=51298 RepID=UPI001749E85E|nr:uncharacterized protein LOC118653645 isoform X3 [Myotis myotis]
MSDLLRVDRSPTDCPISAYVAPGQRRGSVPPACGRGPRPGEPVTGCLHVSPAASAPVPPSPAWSGARGTAASVRRGQHLRTRRASAQLGWAQSCVATNTSASADRSGLRTDPSWSKIPVPDVRWRADYREGGDRAHWQRSDRDGLTPAATSAVDICRSKRSPPATMGTAAMA